MGDWQVTATTIYCDKVDADVTIMVYKDWSTKCVICENYGMGITNIAKMFKKREKLRKELKCEGPVCSKVVEYKDKLFTEETIGKNGNH